MNGVLVWMTRVDSPIRLQSVPPTEKQSLCLLVRQMGYGEKPWAKPGLCPGGIHVHVPSLLGSHVLLCPAELVYLKLAAL